MDKMKLKLDQDNLEINGLTIMCHPLGDYAYWIRNEDVVIVFNPGVLDEEPIIFYGKNFSQEEYDKNTAMHYSIQDIVKELQNRRK